MVRHAPSCLLGLAVPLLTCQPGWAMDLLLSATERHAREEQVTSIGAFSDVRPTDWAFQALTGLIERYGCVAGYPDGTYRGSRTMTRYEAAALLNGCLDRITEVTDELKRLMKEFEMELAVLRGRVDGLEARVGELEASQFATTTRLSGLATFVIGANSYGGDFRTTPLTAFLSGAEVSRRYAREAARLQGSTALNYDLQLTLDTSFTGKDLLRTNLRAGNFGDGPWGGPAVGLNDLETNYEADSGPNQVQIDRLFYQFPLGSGFTVTVGPIVEKPDLLAMVPSVYSDDPILDIFTYAGAPGVYNRELGAGAGLWWRGGNWNVSVLYIATNGNVGAPGKDDFFDTDCGGIGTDCSASSFTAQLGYAAENWGLAAAYSTTRPQLGEGGEYGAGLYGGNATPLAVLGSRFSGSIHSFAFSGYWQPGRSGWMPSISVGWGLNSHSSDLDDLGSLGDTLSGSFDGAVSQSWYLGLQWNDVFQKGNSFGMAVGQPTFITHLGEIAVDGEDNDLGAVDGQFAWEWWYRWQVTDNISITPAVFYLSNPLGQLSRHLKLDDDSNGDNGTFNNLGGLIKATFSF
jgi:hypothetical protein